MPYRTYQDAVEHLADAFDHDASDRVRRNMRRAVEEAYRELSLQGYWSYYRRRTIINTVASQNTGSIQYTHSSRTVTLTGATFPSNAAEYRLVIGNTHFDIESYTDSTHIVLPVASNPGADVASGTSYTLYKSEYALPTNFRRLLGIYDTSQRRLIEVVEDATDQMLQMTALWSPGVPIYVSIRNTGETLGTVSLVFSPMPLSARSYDLLYDTRPRPFSILEKYSTGTVSNSSTAVTGSGTTFPASCEGAVMRFSKNSTDEPTSNFGAFIDQNHVENPYDFQSVIASYSSATAVTLKDAPSTNYSGVKYSISDPLDIEDGAMFTAFLRMAEAAYARLMNYENRNEREVAAQRALMIAKESDKRSLDKRQLPVVTQQWYNLSTTQG